MSSASAVVLGAVISGLVGVLVVFFQQKLVGRHEVDAARPVRLCDFSGAGWTATLLFSELALTFTHPHTGWTLCLVALERKQCFALFDTGAWNAKRDQFPVPSPSTSAQLERP